MDALITPLKWLIYGVAAYVGMVVGLVSLLILAVLFVAIFGRR